MPFKKLQNLYTGNNPTYKHVGSVYAITANGGIATEKSMARLNIKTYEGLGKYDVTDSLQILYDVNSFNSLVNSDNVLIDVDTFISEITPEKIVDLGVLNSLYSDFTNHINSFLNYEEGFESLFTIINDIDINGGVFDNSCFIDILNEQVMNSNGEYVKKSVGNIQIPNISRILSHMNDLNVFKNRPQVVNKFVNGDLIYVPNGITITLRLDIDSGNNLQINSIGNDFLNNLNQTSNFKKGDIHQNTVTTPNEIIRTIKVPILLKLTNLSNIVNNVVLSTSLNKQNIVNEKNVSSNKSVTSVIKDDKSVRTINNIKDDKSVITYKSTINNIKDDKSVITNKSTINNTKDDKSVITNKSRENNIHFKLQKPNEEELTNQFVSYTGANGETGENGGEIFDVASYIEGPTGEESSEMDMKLKRPFYNYIKHKRILNPKYP
jgi:hypothetical protein